MRIASALAACGINRRRQRAAVGKAALPGVPFGRRRSNLDFGRSWRRTFFQSACPHVIVGEHEDCRPKLMGEHRDLHDLTEELSRADRQAVHVAMRGRRLLRATIVVLLHAHRRMMVHNLMCRRGQGHCRLCKRKECKSRYGQHRQKTTYKGNDVHRRIIPEDASQRAYNPVP